MEKTDLKTASGGFMKGLKDGIPICLGYIPVSIACGIAAGKAGIGFWLSQLMSVMMYTASGQMAAVNLLEGGETVIFMYALTLFVMNCRYVLFSMSIAQKFDSSMSLGERVLFSIFNTDEIFGVAMKEPGTLKTSYLIGLATLPYVGFVLGNTIGSISTSILPATVSSALGIVIYAMFIAIVVPPTRRSRPILTVVLAALGLSVILECIPAIKQCFSSGWIIIICAVTVSALGAFLFPVEDKEGE